MNTYSFTRAAVILSMYVRMRESQMAWFIDSDVSFRDLESSLTFIRITLDELVERELASVRSRIDERGVAHRSYQLNARALCLIEAYVNESDFFFGVIATDEDGMFSPKAWDLGNRADIPKLESYLGLR